MLILLSNSNISMFIIRNFQIYVKKNFSDYLYFAAYQIHMSLHEIKSYYFYMIYCFCRVHW
jgi:hypothetical protein